MLAPAAPGEVLALVALDHLHRTHEIAAAVADGRCLVARIDGQPVGFAIQGLFFNQIFVELLYVAAGHRRRGIGRALLGSLVASNPGTKIFTSTNASNIPMQALLESEGFEGSGVIDNLDEGDPELVYCRLP